jgi:hypothetical protein
MPTLVLNAPAGKAEQESKRSFESTLASGIGDEYAIWRSLCVQVTPGCGVILLDKDRERRAEGTLIRLDAKSKTGSGIQRYDVYMKDLKIVPYKPERLNRNGVAVI